MMARSRLPLHSTAAVALSLTGVLLLAGIGSPGPGGAADEAQGPVRDTERGAASGDGAAEGIEVHGHWTIEVREPDGSLVERRRFENALLESGAWVLVAFVAGERNQLPPAVILDDGDVGSGPCTGQCFIGSPDLSIDASPRGAADPRLILSGSTTAEANGRIGRVRTLNGATLFTSANIDPIEVLEGQVIHVTVRLTFS